MNKEASDSSKKPVKDAKCQEVNNTLCNIIQTHLNQDFIQEDITKTYYNLEDLFAKLGGIGATLQIALGSLGALFMIEFAMMINGVIRRK